MGLTRRCLVQPAELNWFFRKEIVNSRIALSSISVLTDTYVCEGGTFTKFKLDRSIFSLAKHTEGNVNCDSRAKITKQQPGVGVMGLKFDCIISGLTVINSRTRRIIAMDQPDRIAVGL